MKILFIAYYFEPYKGVGAKRVSYWAKNLERITSNENEVTVLTATQPDINTLQDNTKVIYVEDKQKSLFKFLFKQDRGITWIKDLKKYFNSKDRDFDYDVILLTGGPFLHFEIGNFLKKKFGCKIILDFRDPFAVNPLFTKQYFLKVLIKKWLEKRFISNADYVITVNKYCSNLLSKNCTTKMGIIDNGYDEKVVEKIRNTCEAKETSKINIVYAGKLSQGREIGIFLDFVQLNPNILFHYVGNDQELVRGKKNTKIYGVKSYEETLKIINGCEIGLVLTGGNEFESTTKIFDYIGLELKILVVSNREVKSGSIKDVLKKYPNHIFCQNNLEDLQRIITEKGKTKFTGKTDVLQFSRKESLTKLIKILQSFN